MARAKIELSVDDLQEIIKEHFQHILKDKEIQLEVWEAHDTDIPLATLDPSDHRIEVIVDV